MVETTLVYDPKEVHVRANLYKYRGGKEILRLELVQIVPGLPSHGGSIHIQGKPEDMKKLFNVFARVLRSPKIFTKDGATAIA